jgi:PilX N-terminal
MSTRAGRSRQRGATLVVALILLAAMALLSVWAFNAGSADVRIVGNSQSRQEVVTAAQTAIEATISTPLFVQQPTAVAAAAIPVDIDGDGRPDLNANLVPPPACYRVRMVKVNELDPSSPTDLPCLGSSSAQNPGIETAGSTPNTGDSLCADSDWNVRAVVTDPRTQATAAVNQGVAVRSLVTDSANSCP